MGAIRGIVNIYAKGGNHGHRTSETLGFFYFYFFLWVGWQVLGAGQHGSRKRKKN